MTILIADDEPAIVDLVRFTLEDPQVRLLEAPDGAAALECALRERPDVALLDVQMPYLTGLEVCRRLRALPECAHTRIVLLTAAAQAEDRRRDEGRVSGRADFSKPRFALFCERRIANREDLVEDRRRGLAAGADHYLTKPFSPLALLTLIRSLAPEVPLWPAV